MIAARHRFGRDLRGFRHVTRHDVEHVFAGGEKIIRDDAAMATPPHGFRAHDRAAHLAAERDEIAQRAVELRPHRVIGVVVEALVVPEAVHLGRDVLAAPAPPAECFHVLVAEAVARERG